MDYEADVQEAQRQAGVEDFPDVFTNAMPHAPEMESFPVPQYNENVLAEMVWRMDLSMQQGIDMADHYNTSSTLWQEA
ncbi:hypothetical protein A2U01_0094973, partial [Trifolium medium]|nr:hypothetical protein [Trifolium medium]